MNRTLLALVLLVACARGPVCKFPPECKKVCTTREVVGRCYAGHYVYACKQNRTECEMRHLDETPCAPTCVVPVIDE